MSAANIVALITATRRAFQALKAKGDALHEDLGVTASLRALLEQLDARGPAPAPSIARARNVSRQHIQQLVDAALAAGLVEACANPAHRRSPLIALTTRGKEVFAEIRARERVAIATLGDELGADFAGRDAAIAAAALDRLTRTFAPSTIEGDEQ